MAKVKTVNAGITEEQNQRLVEFEAARRRFTEAKIEVNSAQVHFDNTSNRLAIEIQDSIKPDLYLMPGVGRATESWVNLVIGKHIKETDEYVASEKRLMDAKEDYLNKESELNIATERLGVVNHQVRLEAARLLAASGK